MNLDQLLGPSRGSIVLIDLLGHQDSPLSKCGSPSHGQNSAGLEAWSRAVPVGGSAFGSLVRATVQVKPEAWQSPRTADPSPWLPSKPRKGLSWPFTSRPGPSPSLATRGWKKRTGRLRRASVREGGAVARPRHNEQTLPFPVYFAMTTWLDRDLSELAIRGLQCSLEKNRVLHKGRLQPRG